MPVFPPIINNNISNIRDTLHITLTAAGWANNQQVIPCNSVGSNSTVMPNPTAASKDAYINAGIELTEATAESLTFTCSTVPTEDIAVLVHIIDPLITVEPFVVNLSGSLNDEYLTSDKTYDEVEKAYMDGKNVVFKYMTTAFGYITYLIVFTNVTRIGGGDFNSTAYFEIGDNKYRYILSFSKTAITITSETEKKEFDLAAMGMPVVENIGVNCTLRVDTTDIYNAFVDGSVTFTFDFLVSGNKVHANMSSIQLPSLSIACGSAILVYDGAWIAAYIVVNRSAGTIQIQTKALM